MVTDGTFESIAILPGDGEEDIIWLCVVREIDGSTVRYIERVAPDQLRALKDGEVSDLTFSDAAITVEPAGSATGDVIVSGLAVDVPTLAYDGDVITRPSYSADSGNYTLTAELPKAYGTLDPTGADNSIFFEAVTGGTGGNSITVEIAADAVQSITGVAVASNAITVTPGAKAVMVVTGLTGDMAAANGRYLKGTGLRWNHETLGPVYKIATAAGRWAITNPVTAVYGVYSIGVTSFPDEAIWAGGEGTASFGVPTVTSAASTAGQVVTAVNANIAASALVTASSTGTGSVAAVAATPLTGGSDTPRWRLTAAGSVWLGNSTETYPWDILPGDWAAVSPATGVPTIQPAESTIIGLSHLEGEEVVILADGSVHRPVTVSGGAITLDYPVTKAVVGIPYTALLEPTWLESPDVAGFSKAGKKRIHRIITELWKTAGVELSVDNGATWKPMETRAVSDLMDSNRTLITGLREEFVGGSTARQISCILRSKDPLPMLLQSLHIRYQIDAK
jgi:hypothetical protein